VFVVWCLLFGVCCLKGSMGSRGCIINGIASKFHNVATAHGSPLTWESGWACLPVGMGEVIEKNTK